MLVHVFLVAESIVYFFNSGLRNTDFQRRAWILPLYCSKQNYLIRWSCNFTEKCFTFSSFIILYVKKYSDCNYIQLMISSFASASCVHPHFSACLDPLTPLKYTLYLSWINSMVRILLNQINGPSIWHVRYFSILVFCLSDPHTVMSTNCLVQHTIHCTHATFSMVSYNSWSSFRSLEKKNNP